MLVLYVFLNPGLEGRKEEVMWGNDIHLCEFGGGTACNLLGAKLAQLGFQVDELFF